MRAETKFDDGDGPSNIASANLQHPPSILPPNEAGHRLVARFSAARLPSSASSDPVPSSRPAVVARRNRLLDHQRWTRGPRGRNGPSTGSTPCWASCRLPGARQAVDGRWAWTQQRTQRAPRRLRRRRTAVPPCPPPAGRPTGGYNDGAGGPSTASDVGATPSSSDDSWNSRLA